MLTGAQLAKEKKNPMMRKIPHTYCIHKHSRVSAAQADSGLRPFCLNTSDIPLTTRLPAPKPVQTPELR